MLEDSTGADPARELAALNGRIGIPARLRDIGVTESVLPAVARGALADNAHKTNPRPLTEGDYFQLLNAAY